MIPNTTSQKKAHVAYASHDDVVSAAVTSPGNSRDDTKGSNVSSTQATDLVTRNIFTPIAISTMGHNPTAGHNPTVGDNPIAGHNSTGGAKHKPIDIKHAQDEPLVLSVADIKLDLIVAHYNEKLDWLDLVDPSIVRSLTIYHKGDSKKTSSDYGLRWSDSSFSTIKRPPLQWIRLPNVGRESHTIAWHCRGLKRGDSKVCKTDHTVFLQGDIRDHLSMGTVFPPQSFIKYRDSKYVSGRRDVLMLRDRIPHHGKWAMELKTGKMKPAPYGFATYFHAMTGRPLAVDGSWWSYHNMFSVINQRLLAHDVQLYERLLATLEHHVNPETGHYFERLCRSLFAGADETDPDSDELWLPILA